MELYKSRTFGDFFSDSFAFFKQNGKHFFKNYFIINGVFILAFIAVLFMGFYFFGDFLGLSGVQASGVDFDHFANENAGVFILLFSLMVIIITLMSVINYTFTPFYLKLYEAKGKDFSTKDIIDTYKQNLGKVIIFVLVCILLMIPTVIAAAIPYLILMFTFVGIYWMVGIIMFIYNGAFLEYINSKKGVFESFGYSITLIFGKKFWHASGAIWLYYLMVSFIIAIPIVILYFFFIISIITEKNFDENPVANPMFLIALIVVYALILLMAVIANNFIQLNQGIVYYSLKEEKENINTKSIIDEIGTSTE
ncbi:hypothetical protein MQE36_16700 [Zhouia spongiae]|uniref:DUF4013 domain-containing protein n=1 Tax=Zhouia spongiae TaxID=2202721 RepID=A0ABY3YNG6_9FLAO|nr:hypothetical protein [Zhouia spongiae]UNY98703.1 hypothetical protein MQE36_16700 [Zhouia spongiae]